MQHGYNERLESYINLFLSKKEIDSYSFDSFPLLPMKYYENYGNYCKFIQMNKIRKQNHPLPFSYLLFRIYIIR